jgi:hypothetical protein
MFDSTSSHRHFPGCPHPEIDEILNAYAQVNGEIDAERCQRGSRHTSFRE